MSAYSHTNDLEMIKAARDYMQAAIADGWEHAPTYTQEVEERACSLTREGYKMMIIAREALPEDRVKNSMTSICIWGPDSLAIIPPDTYDFVNIVENSHLCNFCKKVAEQTHRVGFAGRSCAECLPKQKAKHEYPGWTN